MPAELGSPAAALDPKVLEIRSQFGECSSVYELVRQGVHLMLQPATEMEAEVDDFPADWRDDRGGYQRQRRFSPIPSDWRSSSLGGRQ